MRTRLHQSQLLAKLKAAYPQLAKALNAEENLLTFQVEHFRRHVQTLIDEVDHAGTEAGFDIAARYFVHGNRAMREAIDTEFVEPMDFADSARRNRRWAWDMLPDPLKAAYTAFHGKEPAG